VAPGFGKATAILIGFGVEGSRTARVRRRLTAVRIRGKWETVLFLLRDFPRWQNLSQAIEIPPEFLISHASGGGAEKVREFAAPGLGK
jgi:hypothetical protein